MPINILSDGKLHRLEPTENWQSKNLNAKKIKVDDNFYVHTNELNL
jgi:hypothetical protein